MSPLQHPDESWDQFFRQLLQEQPQQPIALNEEVKRMLHCKIQENATTRRLSIWYLPMVANSLLCACILLNVLVCVSSPMLQAALICGVLDLFVCGIALTIVGIHYAKLIDQLTINISIRRPGP